MTKATRRQLASAFDDLTGQPDPALKSMVQRNLRARAAEAGSSEFSRRMQMAVAATLVVAIAAGVDVWIHRSMSVSPATTKQVPTPLPPSPSATLPVADLQAAGLAGTPAAVTSFDQAAKDGAYTLTLIGLYADSTRTIIFFHIDPDPGFEPGSLRIADQEGELNAWAFGNRGVPGDYVYQFNAGPHAGADGYTQLTIRVLALTPLGLPKRVDGNWVFTARVRVGPAV